MGHAGKLACGLAQSSVSTLGEAVLKRLFSIPWCQPLYSTYNTGSERTLTKTGEPELAGIFLQGSAAPYASSPYFLVFQAVVVAPTSL